MAVVSSIRMLLIRIALFTLLLTSSTINADDVNKNEQEKDQQDDGDDDKGVEANTGSGNSVTYDGRSLIINGKRDLLFSGSIHYPRSTPDLWPQLLMKAKKGGLNVVETYVFWNAHEPVEGKFNFEGNCDLVKFIKMIWQYKMWAILRVGPFIQAEWNHGGLPYWLREVPNMTFRSNNEPFKKHMKVFVTAIIDRMKEEKLFAPQGGPIILSQIENEYNTIQLAFREQGDQYVQWAAKMAVALDTGVPWIMCKQKDAPDPTINTCNGRHCGDTFIGPNKPYKPSLWTENWTAQFRVFGDPPSQRSAEDLAYSIVRFFSKNGSMSNYYMYHGGTNYGRTAAAFVTTRYYDEAPLDEFGLEREPKWGHLKDAHKALNLCKKALFYGVNSVQKLAPDQEARVFEVPGTQVCAAFLANNSTKKAQTIRFRNQDYILPAHSITVLPDCKTFVFNTHRMTTQHNARNFLRSAIANKNFNWMMYKEPVPSQLGSMTKEPLELYGLTKDTTDYAWFTTIIDLSPRDLPMKKNVFPVLRIASLGHGILAFVNGEYIGNAHGSKVEKSFVFQQPVKFKPGDNQISLLGYLVGYPDSGPYMERRYAGPRSVTILGLNTGTLDLSVNGWGHQVGLSGERDQIFNEKGVNKVQWTKPIPQPPALAWYKGYFDAPEGNNPVAIRMVGMGKGMVWVNGFSIGRYWMSYLSPLRMPTQSEYQIPRSVLKPQQNLIVILEEEQYGPNQVEIVVVDRDTICSHVSEDHPPSVRLFETKGGLLKPKSDDLRPMAILDCPDQKQIVAVDFASYGDPFGGCGNFFIGNCTYPPSKQIVEKACLGKPGCKLPFDLFDRSACPMLKKKELVIQVKCAVK